MDSGDDGDVVYGKKAKVSFPKEQVAIVTQVPPIHQDEGEYLIYFIYRS